MKMLILLFVLGAAVIGMLRSGLTPWYLITKDELQALQATAKHAETIQAQAQARTSTGTWMWDQKYRTSLEKTTIVSRPEASKSRDY